MYTMLPEAKEYKKSNDESIEYLKQSFRRIVQLGYDGIDFEESEEAFWYCDCDNCKENFIKKANTPEEAKNIANSKLLHTLYDVIRQQNPNCKIGIRAWRQPPLEKPADVMKAMVSSVPPDVGRFWAPGLYVPDSEFEKWTEAFGKDRIWARDTEIKLEVVPKPRLVSDGCTASQSLIPHLFNF